MSTPRGEEKAALLLASLPNELKQRVLSRLGPERSARIRTQMQRLGQGGGAEKILDDVLEECENRLHAVRRTESAERPLRLRAYVESAERDVAGASRSGGETGSGTAQADVGPPVPDPATLTDPVRALPSLGVERLALAP